MHHIHSNAIVPGQYGLIIFFITSVFFKRGLHSTHTTVYTRRPLFRGSFGGLLIDSGIASRCRNSQWRGTLIHFSASRSTDLSEATMKFNLWINPSFVDDIFTPRYSEASIICHLFGKDVNRTQSSNWHFWGTNAIGKIGALPTTFMLLMPKHKW